VPISAQPFGAAYGFGGGPPTLTETEQPRTGKYPVGQQGMLVVVVAGGGAPTTMQDLERPPPQAGWLAQFRSGVFMTQFGYGAPAFMHCSAKVREELRHTQLPVAQAIVVGVVQAEVALQPGCEPPPQEMPPTEHPPAPVTMAGLFGQTVGDVGVEQQLLRAGGATLPQQR
jgi:hypothetical protein